MTDWDARYAAPGYLFGTEPAGFLTAHESFLLPGQRVLAVADGEGRNSVFLAGKGLEVTAIDASEVALEKARALASNRAVSVHFRAVDVLHWDWPEETFDLVVAIFIQFATPDERPALFAGMKRALKPGGTLLIHGYRPEQIGYGTGGPPNAENMYTEDLLQEAFGDFEILELMSYDREIEEGSGHAGMSALIDLVARKPIA